MLGLPELDDTICRQLSRHDLVQCARVSRKWHEAVIPYLWNDLKCIASRVLEKQMAFRWVVAQDYIAQEGHSLEQLPAFVSALTKYGPWIRELPEPKSLLRCLQLSSAHRAGKEPTAHNLLRHLYKRCPAVKGHHLTLNIEDLDSVDTFKMIAESILPHTSHLHITSSSDNALLKARNIKYLLGQCSSELTVLTIDIDVKIESNDREWQRQDEESNPWMLLKQLRLWDSGNNCDSEAFWSWLLKRCVQVEGLEIDKNTGIPDSFAEGMLNYMSNLRVIRLGIRWLLISDDQIATILSGSRHGWKVVELKNAVNFGEASRSALSKHSSTLERLHVEGCKGFKSHDTMQMLKSCPNLHALVDHYTIYMAGEKYRCVDANVFIDRDPKTGIHNQWQCETTLRELSITILGVPGRDTKQGLEFQGQVYGRLARLTNLEILTLGNIRHTAPSPDLVLIDCLEMSLESGLWMLSGLKSLKELGVIRMKSRIGVEEVQWMVKHWPKLRVICGLNKRYGGEMAEEATKWLQQQHREIEVKKN
ncbi:MAG: hypothetical protein J3Q66DRAFT_350384 [Benniella sp.]|nr:MAG: hypothetical protein J3Q66DRAFT_350384 [Benniella sp.]